MAYSPSGPNPPEYGSVRAFLKRWLTTTDHKEIGILYIVTSFSFFVLGGVMALVMRTNLAYPGSTIVDLGTYNRLFSTHGTAMIFLFIIPVLTGFSNYFVPLLIGAKDMAYPRINALGYWMIPPAGALILIGNAPVGWTGYVPLSIQESASVNFWLVGLIMIGTSSIIGSVNFLVTIFKLRAPGVTFKNLSLFVWSVLTTQFMVLMATPVLAAALTMVLADRLLHTCFFSTFASCTTNTGVAIADPILYQHLFWFYSHPAVYIMILPSMGMISEVIPVMSRRPIFGYKAIAYSTVAIGLLGFTVWVHHMFTTGIDIWVRIPFMFATVTIAVPSGVKVFNWLATMWGGKILLRTPMLFAIGFLSMFVIGGVSGVFQASIPLDYQLQDTYFVVAHLHYVLFGGSVLRPFPGADLLYPRGTGPVVHQGRGGAPPGGAPPACRPWGRPRAGGTAGDDAALGSVPAPRPRLRPRRIRARRRGGPRDAAPRRGRGVPRLAAVRGLALAELGQPPHGDRVDSPNCGGDRRRARAPDDVLRVAGPEGGDADPVDRHDEPRPGHRAGRSRRGPGPLGGEPYRRRDPSLQGF